MRTSQEERLFNTYRNFNQVAYNPNNSGNQRLQRLGIEVTNDFGSFQEFYTWVKDSLGPAPSPRHRIIRKDQNKGFKPSNLQWGVCSQTARILHKDARIAYRGKKLNMCDWAEVLDMPVTTIYSRWGVGKRKPKELFAPKKNTGRPNAG
jgi:hypothetical protein